MTLAFRDKLRDTRHELDADGDIFWAMEQVRVDYGDDTPHYLHHQQCEYEISKVLVDRLIADTKNFCQRRAIMPSYLLQGYPNVTHFLNVPLKVVA